MSRFSASAPFRITTISIAFAGAILSTWSSSAAAQDSKLRPPAGEARALVIGVDAYQFEPPLKGAVADARDIESALRRSGVADVSALFDSAADRASMIRSFNELLSRSQAGDLVIVSIAGRGTQEPEHFKGSEPNGKEDVFILAGFDPKTATGSQQRILGSEFNHLIKQFTLKGAQVLFIADAAYGGGLARNVDPRAAEVSYRQVAPYAIARDTLEPISTADDASPNAKANGLALATILTAGDRTAGAPEVRIPGEAGLRGALSYAVARALEGAADENQDGHITKDELIRYVSQLTYQLSDQRQQVPVQPATPSSGSEVLYGRTRGVVLLDPSPKSETRPAPPSPSVALPVPPSLKPTGTAPERPSAALEVVRLAVLGNQLELLKTLQPKQANFLPVKVSDNPDLIWDPTTLDVLANGDVVAHQINRQDLPGAIDRFAAINGFKRLAAKAPQTVRVVQGDKVQSRESRVEIQVSGVAQRALLLFNIAGDGTVQALYPIGSDPPILATTDFKFPVVVREPFGADQIVAITSAQRLGDLEQVLKIWNQQKAAVELYRLVERYAPPDARIGATSLYTGP